MTTSTATAASNVRSAVLLRGAQPHPGWTVEACRDCKGSGIAPAPYQCLHCGGAGYFQLNPNPVAPTYATPAAPKCRPCGGSRITYTAQAWADAWECDDCGHTTRYSLGD